MSPEREAAIIEVIDAARELARARRIDREDARVAQRLGITIGSPRTRLDRHHLRLEGAVAALDAIEAKEGAPS